MKIGIIGAGNIGATLPAFGPKLTKADRVLQVSD
jgi:hypothetical protein